MTLHKKIRIFQRINCEILKRQKLKKKNENPNLKLEF